MQIMPEIRHLVKNETTSFTPRNRLLRVALQKSSQSTVEEQDTPQIDIESPDEELPQQSSTKIIQKSSGKADKVASSIKTKSKFNKKKDDKSEQNGKKDVGKSATRSNHSNSKAKGQQQAKDVQPVKETSSAQKSDTEEATTMGISKAQKAEIPNFYGTPENVPTHSSPKSKNGQVVGVNTGHFPAVSSDQAQHEERAIPIPQALSNKTKRDIEANSREPGQEDLRLDGKMPDRKARSMDPMKNKRHQVGGKPKEEPREKETKNEQPKPKQESKKDEMRNLIMNGIENKQEPQQEEGPPTHEAYGKLREMTELNKGWKDMPGIVSASRLSSKSSKSSTTTMSTTNDNTVKKTRGLFNFKDQKDLEQDGPPTHEAYGRLREMTDLNNGWKGMPGIVATARSSSSNPSKISTTTSTNADAIKKTRGVVDLPPLPEEAGDVVQSVSNSK